MQYALVCGGINDSVAVVRAPTTVAVHIALQDWRCAEIQQQY